MVIHYVLQDLMSALREQVRLVFRNFPLAQIHPHAEQAEQAAEAAGAQGRFWEMHDTLFENQDALEEDDLLAYAEQVGLDLGRFQLELFQGVYAPPVREDFLSGVRSGVNGTPTLWREVRFALVLRRCLRYAQPPDRVAFDNDPRRAAELLREGRYVRIAHGGTAAGLDCPPMQDLTGGLGPFGLGWSPPTPGGTAFLHERRTASGRRLLAYVVASVDARTGEPLLSVAAFDLRGWSTPPLFAGGMLYTASDLRTMAGLSWAPGEPLRLLAGQPDPNDPSRFSVGYESASGRGRIAVRLHEAEQQGLPAGWVSVAVEQERSPATGRTHSAHPR